MAHQLLFVALRARIAYGVSVLPKKFVIVFSERQNLMSTVSATSIQMDFMKVLIAQLQNQNPLEPLDNNEMASQMAQFSQLQQLESMNTNFAEVLATTRRTYANSLIGKEVTFMIQTESGTAELTSSIVEQVCNEVDGKIFLLAGDYTLLLEDVIAVKN